MSNISEKLDVLINATETINDSLSTIVVQTDNKWIHISNILFVMVLMILAYLSYTYTRMSFESSLKLDDLIKSDAELHSLIEKKKRNIVMI